MNAELLSIAQLLEHAHRPEDVFGTLEGNQAEALRAAYRRLTKVAHPDRYFDAQAQVMAERTFRALQKWVETAEERIRFGVYGQGYGASSSPEPVLVRSRKHDYIVQPAPFAQGDLCNLYQCTYVTDGKETPAIFKAARDPNDNDLVTNEASILRALATSNEYKQFHAYMPRLLESFEYRDPTSPASRRVNMLAFEEGQYYTLPAIRASYTEGIDPKHMAWIWRRVLIALGFAHSCGIIHGAVLPTHVLVQPEQHGVVLIDWSYALKNPAKGAYIPALMREYQAWYPPEVLAKEMPSASTDLYMGARCMVYLLGGDPAAGTLPDTVPQKLQTFFRGVVLKKPLQRPQNALTLLDEFTDLIETLWGPRTFRAFFMPKP